MGVTRARPRPDDANRSKYQVDRLVGRKNQEHVRCWKGLEAVLDLYKTFGFSDATTLFLLNPGRVGTHRAKRSSGHSRASKAVHDVYGSATQPGRRVTANKGCSSSAAKGTRGAQGVHS